MARQPRSIVFSRSDRLSPYPGEFFSPFFALLVGDFGKQNLWNVERVAGGELAQGCGHVIGPGGIVDVHALQHAGGCGGNERA